MQGLREGGPERVGLDNHCPKARQRGREHVLQDMVDQAVYV